MSSIRPVLLVGAGDFSAMRAALRAHGMGTMVAPSCERAQLMLRNFQVDAIVASEGDSDELRSLSASRAPLIVLGGNVAAAHEAGCAAFIASDLDVSLIPGVVLRVIRGERGIQQTRGAA